MDDAPRADPTRRTAVVVLGTIAGSVLLVALLVGLCGKPARIAAVAAPSTNKSPRVHPTAAADRSSVARIKPREPWMSSRVVGSPDPPPPYRTVKAFGQLRFRSPVVLAKPPGMNRFFVGEQFGKIYSFVNSPDCANADLALDVDRQVLAPALAGQPISNVDNSGVRGLEALYGLTFHPNFAENRYCYVCYVVKGEEGKQLPDGTRVSRFKVTDSDPPQLDPASEQVVITWLQGGHNGGCLCFSPVDGCLYISTGDGGFANPPDGRNAGQDVTNLLSSVLRIDVDHPDEGRGYRIPGDNPLVDIPGARDEIWCYGLRNPWKMSFDRKSGELWIGDVGWELWELVFCAERGGNYGWSVVEGRQAVHPERKVGPTPILPPTVEIPHTDGVSITGGHVYRGQKFPELDGQYLFGDWETRRLWSVTWDATTKTAGPKRDLVDPQVRLVAFAEDDAGEIYMFDYDDGTIHTLERNESTAEFPPFPVRLSETGLFASVVDVTPAPGVYPFVVNVDQWTDGASAKRWVAVPNRQTVRMLPHKLNIRGSMFTSSTVYPANTVLVKTLSLATADRDASSPRRIETQLLHFDGNFWRGYSYQWNDEQTDAELVGPLGTEMSFPVRRRPIGADADRIEPLTWHFSSRVECARCHNQWAEYALAFNLRQLNRPTEVAADGENQLRAFERLGIIELPPAPGDDHPRFVNPYDASQPLDQRARSYLHVNCAHCHRGGGGGTAYIELQHELPLEATKIVNVRPTQGTFEIADARVVASGDPFRSTMFLRVSKTGSGRMPHIGSEVVDEPAVRMLSDWIKSLPAQLDDALLIQRLRDAGEAEAVERERRDAPRRQFEIAQRIANQRRERDLASAQRATLPPVDPAPITDDDRQAARREDEQAAQNRVRDRAKVRREAIERLLDSTSRALRLARAVDESPLPTGVQAELLQAALAHQSPIVRDLFDHLAPPEQRRSRLGAHVKVGEILGLAGDAARGAVLFAETPTIQCKTCHRIGKIGGLVGPELTAIGRKYNRAQMLEHILEPSKVIEPKYVGYVAVTSDGRVISGLLTNRTPDEFVFRDAKDQEIRVAAGDVDSIAPQRQSLMPDLQLRDMTVQQVADLLSYLAEQK